MSVLSKRKVTDIFVDDDSENIDPSTLSSKKAKFTPGKSDGFTYSRPASHFVLKSDNTTSTHRTSLSPSRPIATPRSRVSPGILGSAPRTAPAGRSPPRKRNGGKRLSAPFARVMPPALSAGSMPFSIDAALSGSVSSYNPTAKAAYEREVDSLQASSKSTSWYFDIHEDTPDQELGNLMEFSTQTLDISDDEGKFAKQQELEGPGKENVPPELSATDVSTPVPTALSRKDMMEDGPRTPLGELEATAFYAAGCDETSAFIIDEEVEQVDDKSVQSVPAAFEERDESPSDHKSNQEAWQEILARVDEQQKELTSALPTPVNEAVSPLEISPEALPLPSSQDDAFAIEATSRDEAPLFDIWESESAKEESEAVEST